VHPGLAPDCCVDLSQEGRGHVYHWDASVVHRCREPGGVGDHTAAHRDHAVTTGQAPTGPVTAQLFHGAEVLALLTVGYGEDPVFDAGVDLDGDGGLGHHGDPLHPPGDEAGQFGPRSVAHHHRIA